MWENLLTNTAFLSWEAAKDIGSSIMKNSENIANIANIGAAGYGMYNSHKSLGEAKRQNKLSEQSYYRNTLRQEKEDEAINKAAASIAI